MPIKTAFVTGGAGGLGGATSAYLAERGWQVFAADLPGEALERIGSTPGVTPIELDVTDEASVEAARARVDHLAGGLDAVVNFAGILAVGSLIELDAELVQRIVDVNVLGTIRVNRLLFPLLLRRRGRIVNVSSETGWQAAMPFNGPYSMTKHAIENYSDALRRELMFLDVPVIKVQPGAFRTAMVSSIERHFDEAERRSTYFGSMLGRLKHIAVAAQSKASDPVLVARTVHRALTAPHPMPAYSVKADPQRSALSYLPAVVADALLKRALA